MNCPSGTQLDTVVPSLFQYSTYFKKVAWPLLWLQVSEEEDFKELREFDDVSDALPILKDTMLSSTVGEIPSELDMIGSN